MSTGKKEKGDTYDAFAKVVGGLVVKIQANLSASKSIPMGGTPMTVADLTGGMQGYVTQNTAVDDAKASTANLIAQRKTAKAGMEKTIKQFTTWMLANYGEAGYALFGLPPPKPRKTTPKTAAAGVEKRQVTAQAKAAAKAAVAPKGESMVLYGASGDVIGATQPPVSTTAAPAAAAVPSTTAGK